MTLCKHIDDLNDPQNKLNSLDLNGSDDNSLKEISLWICSA